MDSKSPLGIFLLSMTWLGQKLWLEREMDMQWSLVRVLVAFTLLSLGSNGKSPLGFDRRWVKLHVSNRRYLLPC